MMNASDIVTALGGTSAVASALNLTPSTVSSWKSNNSIPKWRMRDVVALAKKKGVALPPEPSTERMAS